MGLGKSLAAEIQYEAISTRKMLEIVPFEKLSWQPHEKSMTLGALAKHVAEIPQWTRAVLTQDEMDFTKTEFPNVEYQNAAELRARFDSLVNDTFQLLQKITDKQMKLNWQLRNGEQILMELPRVGVIRTMVINHLIHHRGQLSVYLRLNNVLLPSVYGPTADEQTF